jgi:hypothetical protein
MNYSLHYVLALSLIAAPVVANDCTENASVVVEVIQPEQEVVQPFYKKVGQKLWEHKNKIAITLFTVGLVAASTYVLWKAGVSQQAVTPETLLPVNAENLTQPSSTTSVVTETKAPSTTENAITKIETTPSENAATPNQEASTQLKEAVVQTFNFCKETGSNVLSGVASFVQEVANNMRTSSNWRAKAAGTMNTNESEIAATETNSPEPAVAK